MASCRKSYPEVCPPYIVDLSATVDLYVNSIDKVARSYAKLAIYRRDSRMVEPTSASAYFFYPAALTNEDDRTTSTTWRTIAYDTICQNLKIFIRVSDVSVADIAQEPAAWIADLTQHQRGGPLQHGLRYFAVEASPQHLPGYTSRLLPSSPPSSRPAR